MQMQPIILIILDGWGINLEQKGNAISVENTPFINKIEKSYPFMTLTSSGLAVGLPYGEAGNSEVGHMAIGTGRITYQYLPRIMFAIQDGTFFKNPVLSKAVEHVRKNNSSLHIMGLTSSGTVHSYIDHLDALLEFAKKEKISKVFLHAFTDGKDSLPREAKTFLPDLSQKMQKNKLGKMVTVLGRNFAMDRDGNWDKTQKAYQALTSPGGAKSPDLIKSITDHYNNGSNDQDMTPTILEDTENTRIKDNDAVIFFNFREDSARQLTQAFVKEKFDGFQRTKIKNLFFATMTRYEDNLPINVMFDPPNITNSLSEVLSKNKKKHLKIAETEKYAHVTYFFNGLAEKSFPLESRLIIPSLKAGQYKKFPKMKAPEITEQVIKAFEKRSHDVVIANFANADMLGHSGDFNAAQKGIKFLDKMLEKIYNLIIKEDGIMIITGDHGNAEEMVDPISGNVKTEHTTNPVPFYLVSGNIEKLKTKEEIAQIKKEPRGLLGDIAPTILDIMSIEKPKEMTGKSLLSYL